MKRAVATSQYVLVVIFTITVPWRYPNVEKLDVITAVNTYRPQLVLCAWMPLGVDWTAAWRLVDSGVAEYVQFCYTCSCRFLFFILEIVTLSKRFYLCLYPDPHHLSLYLFTDIY